MEGNRFRGICSTHGHQLSQYCPTTGAYYCTYCAPPNATCTAQQIRALVIEQHSKQLSSEKQQIRKQLYAIVCHQIRLIKQMTLALIPSLESDIEWRKAAD